MANLEKLYDNNFVVTDEDSLFLDPEAHDQLRKNLLASISALNLKTEIPFGMEHEMNGTESSQLLINHWHKVAATTLNFKNFYINHVDPTLVNVAKSIDTTANDVSDQLIIEDPAVPTSAQNLNTFAVEKIDGGNEYDLNTLKEKAKDYEANKEYFQSYMTHLNSVGSKNWTDEDFEAISIIMHNAIKNKDTELLNLAMTEFTYTTEVSREDAWGGDNVTYEIGVNQELMSNVLAHINWKTQGRTYSTLSRISNMPVETVETAYYDDGRVRPGYEKPYINLGSCIEDGELKITIKTNNSSYKFKTVNMYSKIGEEGYQNLLALGMTDAEICQYANSVFTKEDIQFISNIKDCEYVEYFTGDIAVDEEIVNLLEDDNLIESVDDGSLSWDSASETVKEAVGRIYDVDVEYIDGHISNQKCADEEARVSAILGLFTNYDARAMAGGNDPYVYTVDGEGNQCIVATYAFNNILLDEFSGYCDSEVAKDYIADLQNATIKGQNTSYHEIDVKIVNAGVVFGAETIGGSYEEILCHTSYERSKAYVDYYMRTNPECYEYTLALMGDDIEKLYEFYTCAETAADCKLYDNLMKADASYEGVFNVDPEGLSGTAEYNLAAYGANVAMNAQQGDNKYCTAYNNFLSQMASADYGQDCLNENEYLSTYAVASKLYRQTIVDGALAIPAGSLSEAEENKLTNMINAASYNELAGFSLYQYGVNADDKVSSVSLTLDFENNNQITITEFDEEGNILSIVDYQMSLSSGYGGLNLKDGCELCELQEEEDKLAAELGVKSAIAVVSIFSDDLGNALSLVADVCMDNGSAAISDVADMTSEVPYLSGGLSLLSVLAEYEEGMLKISEKREDIFDETNVQLFYNVGAFNVGKTSGGYYIAITDPNKINMIRDWNAYGISVLDERLDEQKIINRGTIDNIEENNAIKGKYTHEEVVKAVNTLVYGSGGENTYDSILDVPGDILLYFCIEMKDYVEDNHIADSLADVAQDYKREEDNNNEESCSSGN